MLIEKQVDYAVECVRKLQRERLRSMEVKREAVMDYDEYVRVSWSGFCFWCGMVLTGLFARSIGFRRTSQR